MKVREVFYQKRSVNLPTPGSLTIISLYRILRRVVRRPLVSWGVRGRRAISSEHMDGWIDEPTWVTNSSRTPMSPAQVLMSCARYTESDSILDLRRGVFRRRCGLWVAVPKKVHETKNPCVSKCNHSNNMIPMILLVFPVSFLFLGLASGSLR